MADIKQQGERFGISNGTDWLVEPVYASLHFDSVGSDYIHRDAYSGDQYSLYLIKADGKLGLMFECIADCGERAAIVLKPEYDAITVTKIGERLYDVTADGKKGRVWDDRWTDWETVLKGEREAEQRRQQDERDRQIWQEKERHRQENLARISALMQRRNAAGHCPYCNTKLSWLTRLVLYKIKGREHCQTFRDEP